MTKQSQGRGERSVDVLLTTLRRLAVVGVVMTAAGLIPIVIYALSVPVNFAAVVSVGAMTGAAAFVAGGLLGFLFGVPKAPEGDTEGSQVTRHARYRVNTNLEQISDWLTKILVGVGLIQLRQIAAAAIGLISVVAKGMGGSASARIVAGGILVYFLGNGFLSAYYVTRTTLTTAFTITDADVPPSAGVVSSTGSNSVEHVSGSTTDHPTWAYQSRPDSSDDSNVPASRDDLARSHNQESRDYSAMTHVWPELTRKRKKRSLVPAVPTKNLSQFSRGLTGRYRTMASMPDCEQDADLPIRISAHCPDVLH